MKLSVVILNWNGEDMLRRFLPSVVEHSAMEDVEICVADNNSTDNSCKVVEEEFPGVRLIHLDQNYGFAEGYNKALKQVKAEYYVLLNSDVEVTDGWIDPILEYMDSHKDVAACQPKILNYQHREYFDYAGAAGGYVDRYGYPYCRGRILDKVEKDTGQYDTIASVFWVSGAAMFIRSSCYHKMGGLDGRFFAHMEEIDLCWRLQWHKYKLVCIPQSKVYHVGGATLKQGNPRKTFLNFRNNLIMLYKNLPDGECKKAMRKRRYLDNIAMIVFALKFDFQNARAVRKARSEFKQMKPDFIRARIETNRMNFSNEEPKLSSFSIVIQSKLLQRKLFSKLNKKFFITK